MKCLYNSLFRSEVDKLLHLLMALINSTSKRGSQDEIGLLGNSFNRLKSIQQS